MDNLDKLVAEQTARFLWIREMFATKQSRILFGVSLLVAFLLGACL